MKQFFIHKNILVGPSQGFIPAGGAQDIAVTLQPKAQQVYNSLVISAFIPGCKV